MDILILARVSSVLIGIVVAFHFILKIPNRSAQIYHSLMIILTLLSVSMVYPHGMIYDWVRQVPFYLSQVLFYFFIDTIIKRYISFASMKNATPLIKSRIRAFALFPFFTEQGLQYILAIPLFFLTYTMVRMRLIVINSPILRSVLYNYLIASVSLTMIQIGYFVVETQHLILSLKGFRIELMGQIWFIIAMICMLLGTTKLHRSIYR